MVLYFILSYFIVTYFCSAPLSNLVTGALHIPLIDWLIDIEAIRIDLHRHLEVTIVQQGHFGITSTVAQKW